MYFLGQFEKCLLTWTKADRLRKNNKEVFRKRQKLLNTHYRGGTVISMFLFHMTVFFVRYLLFHLHVKEAMEQVEDTIHTSLR